MKRKGTFLLEERWGTGTEELRSDIGRRGYGTRKGKRNGHEKIKGEMGREL